MKYVRNNQAGFSLVELMVVVAIIGILASLAIPSIGKYMAKARQSEAKTQLSSLYTAEKAFYAEYSAYHSAFGALGYSPEGKLRYTVGYDAAGTPADAGNGYNTTLAGAQLNTHTYAYCGGATPGTITNGCAMLQGADGTNPQTLPGAGNALTKAAFTAAASAVVFKGSGAAVVDRWTVTQDKVIVNQTAGIP